MRIRSLIAAYRWPAFLIGIMLSTISAYVVLVYVATRADAPQPIAEYYQKSLHWDADQGLIEASRQLGWRVRFFVPGGKAFAASALRPVDLRIQDSAGRPVRGLVGRVLAQRPSASRANAVGQLSERLDQPGSYRTLLRLGQSGLWDLHLDGKRGDTRFVYSSRVDIASGDSP